jgi:oligoendopeptidase F
LPTTRIPATKLPKNTFLDAFYRPYQAADQKAKEKLLASGLEPPGFEIPLRNMRAEASLFRQENLPLLAEEHKLSSRYNKIIGAQTVTWEGEELTVQQLRAKTQAPDRDLREQAWKRIAERQLADREALNALWAEFLALRRQIAQNAGYPDYRAYRWQQLLRFDYTPEDCLRFHQAIEEVVVPAATRLYGKQARRQGLPRLAIATRAER